MVEGGTNMNRGDDMKIGLPDGLHPSRPRQLFEPEANITTKVRAIAEIQRDKE